jgi:parallel beta-helix repeat protein
VKVRISAGSVLSVFGALESLGFEGSPVLITTNVTPPPPFAWARISVRGGSLLAQNTTFEYGALVAARRGINSVVLYRVHYLGDTMQLNSLQKLTITSSEIISGQMQVEDASSVNISFNVIQTFPGLLGSNGIELVNSSDASIIGNVIKGFSTGIHVDSDRVLVLANEVSECNAAIEVHAVNSPSAVDSMIAGNRLKNNLVGIGIRATRSTIQRNHISGSSIIGISINDVPDPSYVTISDNTVVSNAEGIRVAYSLNVTIESNIIRGNDIGVYLMKWRPNGFHLIYHNWFIDNAVQAIDSSTSTSWDNGYPSGGNHWSDYVGDDVYRGPLQDIPGPDGFGDIPRRVGPNGMDRYPFYAVPAPGAPRNLTAQAVGPDVVLSWETVPMADDYLLYEAGMPTGFDLSSSIALGNVTSWIDAGAAAAPGARYYVLRARNATWDRAGPTSNTAGKWTHSFPAGTSTISLPLEPFPWVNYTQPSWVDTVGEFVAKTGATSIAYMDAGAWLSVPGSGDPGRTLRLGEGYVTTLSTPTMFTFTGLPGAMIDYAEWPPYALAGFDPATTARSIAATVQGDDVLVEWSRIPGFGLPSETYEVYYATMPWKLRGSPWTDYRLLTTVSAQGSGTASVVHTHALLAGSRWSYFVVPVRDGHWRGSSTYSVSVNSIAWGPGYAAVGLPLRPYSNGTYLSPLASSLAVANISGVQWYDTVRVDWTAHAAWMPPGTYDVPLEMVMAVQVCALNPTRIVFTGV